MARRAPRSSPRPAPTPAAHTGTPWDGPPILTPGAVAPLSESRARGEVEAQTSLDLGLSTSTVRLTPTGVALPAYPKCTGGPGGPAVLVVSWEDLASVASATTGGGPRGGAGGRCFAVRAHAVSAPEEAQAPNGPPSLAPRPAILEEVQVFSAQSNRRYSLLATAGAPTMLVSGVQMHRTSGEDPWSDTLAKVRCVAPVVGRVLDTCTGLGYTAIVAAGSAGSAGGAGAGVDVLTIEIDPGAVAVARLNPWSRPLFEHPRIERRMGDSAEVVQELPDGAFARIIHDPPVLSLAGDLYSGAFYRHLHRVLGRGGRLFHYVGNAASGSGARVTRGVQQRLHEAGFSRVLARPEAFGVLALK